MTTTGTGVVFGTYASLPFGDGASITSGQDDTPFDEFSGLSDWFNGILGSADHAQFREYSNAQGRWLSPDPSSGSYDFSNPQTFNRYSYVRNNPMAFNDPSGLDKGLEQNGLPGAGFLFGPEANEFALLAIPVYGSVQYGVNDVYIGSTAYGNLLGGQGFSDNYMSVPGLGYPYLGNAFELTTNNPQLLDEVPGAAPIRPLVSSNGPNNPTQQQPTSPLLNYLTFLGCEFNNDIVQLTSEEDAQSPMQIPIVASAAAVVGALNGKLPGWTGVTGVLTGGLYAIDIAGNSNTACTNSVYGH